MLTAAVDATIEPHFLSDHNPISFTFTMGTPKGKGYWKFPDFLLSDKQFKSEMVQCIAQTRRDNAEAEPGLLWDVVKMNIRGCAVDHLARAKKVRKQSIESIEQCIHHNTLLRDHFATDPYKAAFFDDKVKHLQQDLDSIYDNLNAPARKLAVTHLHYESNRYTKYYFQLPGTK